MMEFKAVIRVDTQDPKLAYNEVKQALQFCGLDVVISDEWTLNTRSFDNEEACQIAAHWNMIHDQMTVDQRIKFSAPDERWQKACVAAHNEIHRILNQQRNK